MSCFMFKLLNLTNTLSGVQVEGGLVGLFRKHAVLLGRPQVADELEGVALEVAADLGAELALALLDGRLHDVIVAGHVVVRAAVDHLGGGEESSGVAEEASLWVEAEGLFRSRAWVCPQQEDLSVRVQLSVLVLLRLFW